MSDVLIEAEHISKKYCRYLRDSMVYGLTDVCRNAVGLSSNSGRLRKNEFWSVDDISFKVRRGETIGLVGANGSGKTTTLKMLNGIFWPDKGKITVRGRVGALIAVGAGFHPLLTGRENVYVNGAILGMSKKEVDQKFKAIVDFADIGDFIDSPVKHYSSGMYVRLGFSVAVHSNCDILLIDEILSVGDIYFQAKCVERIMERAKQGVAIIFVSHSFESVELLCKNTIYLSKGKILQYGRTDKILAELRRDVAEGRSIDAEEVRPGTGEIEIKKVELFDRSCSVSDRFRRGERLQVKVTYIAKKPVNNPNFEITFKGVESGLIVHHSDMSDYAFKAGHLLGAGEVIHTIDSIQFPAGKYWLKIGCWNPITRISYNSHEKVCSFIVEESDDTPYEWGVHKES